MMVPRGRVVGGVFGRINCCIAMSGVAVKLNRDSAFVVSLPDIKGAPPAFP